MAISNKDHHVFDYFVMGYIKNYTTKRKEIGPCEPVHYLGARANAEIMRRWHNEDNDCMFVLNVSVLNCSVIKELFSGD